MEENKSAILTAYNVRTKEKNVPIQEAVISKTSKGAYMAKGVDANGGSLTTLLNGQKAYDAVKAGTATLADEAGMAELEEKYGAKNKKPAADQTSENKTEE